MLADDGSKRVPLKELYGAFARPQTPAEAEIGARAAADLPCGLPPSAGKDASPSKHDFPDLGKTEPQGARLLLRDIGRSRYDLVGLATTRGAVALGLFPGGSGSCGLPTVDGLVLAAQSEARGAIVFGLVDDDVKSVDLVIDGASISARLGENGFAQEISNAKGKALDRIVLRHSDGSVSEFPPE